MTYTSSTSLYASFDAQALASLGLRLSLVGPLKALGIGAGLSNTFLATITLTVLITC